MRAKASKMKPYFLRIICQTQVRQIDIFQRQK